jgi:hypothetical protein
MVGHGQGAVAVGGATQARNAQLWIAQRRSLAALGQCDPHVVRQLRADLVELQCAQRAEHTLGHALADLDPGLTLGDICIGQPVQAMGDALQLALLVQMNQQLQ